MTMPLHNDSEEAARGLLTFSLHPLVKCPCLRNGGGELLSVCGIEKEEGPVDGNA